MVFLLYAAAVLGALLLLYFFHARWYWHVLSVVLALAIGLAPPAWIPLPAAWGMSRDVVLGCVFLFLVVWGLCAPFFAWAREPGRGVADPARPSYPQRSV
jgi:hypothetical protein